MSARGGSAVDPQGEGPGGVGALAAGAAGRALGGGRPAEGGRPAGQSRSPAAQELRAQPMGGGGWAAHGADWLARAS